MLPLLRRGGLHHQEGEEALRRINPEVGPADPAPVPVADAPWERRLASDEPHRDAEPEAVTRARRVGRVSPVSVPKWSTVISRTLAGARTPVPLMLPHPRSIRRKRA